MYLSLGIVCYDDYGDFMIVDTLTNLFLSKKQVVIQTLKQLNIPYDVSKNVISFTYQPYENVKTCVFTLHFFMHKLGLIRLTYEVETTEEGNQVLSILKNNLVETYNKPNSDNSKHQTNDIYITWHEHTHITLSKHDEDLSVNIVFTREVPIKNSNKVLFGVSMVAGLIWGILFFILMGLAYDFDLFLFIISMVGGLIWGAIFGITMIYTNQKKAVHKYPIFKKRDIAWFKSYELEKEFLGDFQRCLCTFRDKHRVKLYKTTLYFEDHKFNFVYISKGRLFEKTLPHTNIDYYYDYGDQKQVVIRLNDQTQLAISNQEGLDVLIPKLDMILGYAEERFFKIKQKVYESIIAFDPAGLIEGGADVTIFEADAKNITKSMYMENPMSEADLKTILENYFIDTPIKDWSILSKDIFEKTHIL